jgi:ADP-ribose pyrophosphatase
MQPWRLRGKRTLLHQPPWLTVESHEIELPNGTVIPDWAWVITPDFVNILVQRDDGCFLVFEQTKYAIDGITLAPVGGYIETNEDPLAAAQRELREEMGYEANAWHYFGKFAVDGNRGAGHGHFFLATGAHKVSEPNRDDLEEMRVLTLRVDELRAAALAGRFALAPWAACVALALLATSG